MKKHLKERVKEETEKKTFTYTFLKKKKDPNSVYLKISSTFYKQIISTPKNIFKISVYNQTKKLWVCLICGTCFGSKKKLDSKDKLIKHAKEHSTYEIKKYLTG